MGIKEYMKESVSTYAFWISPKGKIAGGLQSHISQIISAPENFGITREWIDQKHQEYGERIGQEGKAREEIIKEVLKDGFIRIRKYKNDEWVINVHRISKKNKERIVKWAEKITENGIDGIKASPMDKARITDMGSYNEILTMRKLSTGSILFESISDDIEIIECQSVKEFDIIL